jgi:hypothetical protein
MGSEAYPQQLLCSMNRDSFYLFSLAHFCVTFRVLCGDSSAISYICSKKFLKLLGFCFF